MQYIIAFLLGVILGSRVFAQFWGRMGQLGIFLETLFDQLFWWITIPLNSWFIGLAAVAIWFYQIINLTISNPVWLIFGLAHLIAKFFYNRWENSDS